MQQRKLGKNGPDVSAIGYGAMGVHLAYGAADAQSGLDLVKRAYDLGVTFFDTAELYGWGENEKFIGQAVKGFRDDITIATKFGFTFDNGTFGANSQPEHIRKVTENSLRYLGVEQIELKLFRLVPRQAHERIVPPHSAVRKYPSRIAS